MSNKTFAHNVSQPPAKRFNRPELGGRFAGRIVDVDTTDGRTCIAWHGYDPDGRCDDVWCKRPDGRAVCVSRQPGDHHRPTVAGGHMVWIADQRTIMHDGEPIATSEGWLRDPAICREGDALWLVVIQTVGEQDALLIYHHDGRQWSQRAAADVPGAIWRASALATDAGLVIAYDAYENGLYHIETRTFDSESLGDAQCIDMADEICILPRLTPGPDGQPWVSFLSERFVMRDGILGRAARAQAARFDGKTWRRCGDGYRLYRALLPIERYFGYDGLRRNPRLCATDDGAMYLVFEQQRDETETWENLNNGYLTAMKWTGDDWDGPYRWLDGGCCFAFDHRVVHDANAVPVSVRGEHREDGMDHDLDTVNPAAAPRVEDEDFTQWSGWQPYRPVDPGERPSIEIDGETYCLYFGDLHNHGICSPDADGFQDELYYFARDVARIDFAGITDNDYYPDNCFQQSESEAQKRICHRVMADGAFVAFAGFEWTFHRPDEAETFNHRSVIFHDDDQQVVRRIEPAAHTEDAMRDTLNHMNAFAHAHHGQYLLLGTEAEANVEIVSAWAVNIDAAPTPHEELDRGMRFGFIGGTDSHRMTPGLGGALVAVWAEALTREAIVEALRARRCYATTGNRTVIDFRASDQPMGSVVQWDGKSPITFDIAVRTQRPLKRVTLIRGGETVHAFDVGGHALDGQWTDDDPPADGAWYYLRVEDDMPYKTHPHNVSQAVGPWAWSSPIWIERK